MVTIAQNKKTRPETPCAKGRYRVIDSNAEPERVFDSAKIRIRMYGVMSRMALLRKCIVNSEQSSREERTHIYHGKEKR